MRSSYHVRLDWAIVGWTHDGGATVLASDQLERGELEALTDVELDPFSLFGRRPGHTRYRLEVHTRAHRHGDGDALIVMAHGADYAEALRRLMDFWQPRGARPEGIAEAPRALGGGTP